MNTIIILISGIFAASFVYLAGYVTATLFQRNKNYAGTMKIVKEDERTLFSLELQEDPTLLEHMNEIVFKVETSDESSNRK